MKNVSRISLFALCAVLIGSACKKENPAISEVTEMKNDLKNGPLDDVIANRPWGANWWWVYLQGVNCYPRPANCFDVIVIRPDFSDNLKNAADNGREGVISYFNSYEAEHVFPGMFEVQNTAYLFLLQNGLITMSYEQVNNMVSYRAFYDPKEVPEELHNGYIEENNVFVLRTEVENY